MKGIKFLWLFTLGTLLSARAWAGENESAQNAATEQRPPTLAEARTAFLQGTELLRQEQFAEARKQFSFAASGRRTPGLLYYIALCFEKEGKFTAAYQSYQQAGELLVDVPAADVESLVPSALKRVEGHVGRVRFVGADGSDLDAALRDGEIELVVLEQRVVAGAELMLDPGEYELNIFSKRQALRRLPFTVSAGQTRLVAVRLLLPKLETSSAEKPAGSAVEADDGDRADFPLRPVVVWSGVSVAVLGTAVGVAGGLLLGSANRSEQEADQTITTQVGDSSSACRNPDVAIAAPCAGLQSALDRQRVAEGVMVSGFATAGVGVVTALLGHFLIGRAELAAQPLALQRGGGVLLSTSF